MGLDPELASRARLLPRVTLGPRVLRIARGLNALLPAPSSSAGVDVERLRAPGVDAYVYRPTGVAAPAPALLWFHGGGFVVGSPAQDARPLAALVRALGVVVVAPRYRLAPEHPFPAALDDAIAALAVVPTLRGVREDRIAIGGMSAGGGLAAQLAIHTRDHGGPTLAAQILVYPMLDDRSALRPVDETDLRVWNVRSNHFGWSAYLGVPPGDARASVAAIPSRAASLAGLPPTWIGVGDRDLFHEENVAFASRLQGSGAVCTLEVAAGAYHGFDQISPGASVSKRFTESRYDALRRALA